MAEHDALSAARDGYDDAAHTHADLFRDSLREAPLDRAILGAFAESVSASGGGQVAGLGCGPRPYHRVPRRVGAFNDDPSHPTQVFDHAGAPAYRWWPDHLAALLRKSGLDEVARMVRGPQPTDRRQFQEVHRSFRTCGRPETRRHGACIPWLRTR